MAVRIEAHAEPIPGYTLLDRIGSGGYGEVWRAEAPGGIFKAVKIIHGDLRSKDADLARYAEQELKSLKRVKQVRHPYLLALDRFDIVDGRLMIVMELADRNLWDRFRECRDAGLPGIPRDELLQYMAETAEVLDLFNDRFQLQHLDVKPQNLFLLHQHVKVADFGQVKDLQGLMAEVTGGITPVYAAPETFDGVITRFCDQYSLACVYQELLTGRRPFDGVSMSQLLMQHLNLPPNLDPSPPCDRLALTRALAKKADDRWPTVTEFVRCLQSGVPPSDRVPVPMPRPSAEDPTLPAAGRAAAPPIPATEETPLPLAVETGSPEFAPAPPDTPGPGPLRPALVIGLGGAGRRVVQRLRFDLAERFGPSEATPAVRTLYVDTDPDAVAAAARDRPGERLAGLPPDGVFAATLNRASHYTRPRPNGRRVIDGWFDPQLLYKIPRTPRTLGLRVFGRLAFCDHSRLLLNKVQAELDAALAPEALAATEARTGLARRTNRPRVYVAAGLGGGTGGGMFLDVAYAVRARLRRMGYADPEVIGLLIAPPADPGVTPPQALANTFAALTELHHYMRPETTFVGVPDERDPAPPFTRCYLVPGAASGPTLPTAVGTPPPGRSRTPSGIAVPGSRSVVVPAPQPRSGGPEAAAETPDPVALAALKPHAAAAEVIRLGLFTPVGPAADAARERLAVEADEAAPRGVTVSAFGSAGFGWPRAEVVARLAAGAAREVLRRWTAPDPDRVRNVIPGTARAMWTDFGLDPDDVLEFLRQAADAAAGGSVEGQIAAAADPLAPRGWLGRLPDPARVTLALDQLVKLLGPPAAPGKRPPTPVEQAVAETAAVVGTEFAAAARALGPTLADDPGLRLAGTEELLRQFLATTDRLLERHARATADGDAKARAGFECVSHYAHYQKGMRRPQAGEFADAARGFPRARFQALLGRGLIGVYQALREALAARLAEVTAARQRLAAAAVPDPAAAAEPPPADRRLLPAGCAGVGEVVDRFLSLVTDADVAAIDRRAHAVLDDVAGGVLAACLDPATDPGKVVGLVFEEARAHLDERLGPADLAGMFAGRYRTPQQAERAVGGVYADAEPAWGGPGAAELTVVGCPAGPGGEALRELARRAIPVAGLPVADARDELVVYRERPAVPLAALPHLGPAAAAAYRAVPEAQQCTAHARLDVTRWLWTDGG